MSEQPTAAARPPAAKAPGKKYAGLSRNQWLITGGVFAAALAYILWRRHQAAKTATTATSTSASTATSTALQAIEEELAQLQNQGYGSGGASGGGGTSGSTGTGVAGTSTAAGTVTTTPPASTATATKTTTLTATNTAWAYPAPGGLRTSSVAAKGYYLNWNPVTGPQGQKPSSYTVATYDSSGKEVNQHNTAPGSTQTAEYGKGGTGLPKGTYHSNVWANGGPKAPPHATVSVTLKG